jgi:flagellar biosynthesis protein FlhG
MVRVDPKVKESIRHQTPLLMRSPNTQAAENVEDIANELWRKLRASMRAAASA